MALILVGFLFGGSIAQAMLCAQFYHKPNQKLVPVLATRARLIFNAAVAESFLVSPYSARSLFTISSQIDQISSVNLADRKKTVLDKAFNRIRSYEDLEPTDVYTIIYGVLKGVYKSIPNDSNGKNVIFNNFLFQILRKGLVSETISKEDLFHLPSLESFFKNHLIQSGMPDLVWSQMKKMFPSMYIESDSSLPRDLTVTPEMAAKYIFDKFSREADTENIRKNLEDRFKAIKDQLESRKFRTVVENESLQLTNERLNQLNHMDAFNFMDYYLAKDAQNYFESVLLPLHGDRSRLDYAFQWQNYSREFINVDQDDLKTLVKNLRLTSRYSKHSAIQIDGKNFDLKIGDLLGASKSLVSRAKVEGIQEELVLKVALNSRDDFISIFEYYYTLFATEYLGIQMPRVVFKDFNQGRVLKEYYEGLTYAELVMHYGVDSAAMKELEAALLVEKSIISRMTPDFSNWFKTNYRDDFDKVVSKHPILPFNHDYHKNENWLFVPKLGRWILIDP